jgi:hypothetical protein
MWTSVSSYWTCLLSACACAYEFLFVIVIALVVLAFVSANQAAFESGLACSFPFVLVLVLVFLLGFAIAIATERKRGTGGMNVIDCDWTSAFRACADEELEEVRAVLGCWRVLYETFGLVPAESDRGVDFGRDFLASCCAGCGRR